MAVVGAEYENDPFTAERYCSCVLPSTMRVKDPDGKRNCLQFLTELDEGRQEAYRVLVIFKDLATAGTVCPELGCPLVGDSRLPYPTGGSRGKEEAFGLL